MKPMTDTHMGKQIMAAIREKGYGCMGMMPGHGLPGWTYTIGFTLLKGPELVIPDIPGEHATNIMGLMVAATYAQKVVPRAGDKVTLSDGSVWTFGPGDSRATAYGVRWARRLFGDRYQVRALMVLPPRSHAYPKFSPWPGMSCQCGKCPAPNPLAPMLNQVGSREIRFS